MILLPVLLLLGLSSVTGQPCGYTPVVQSRVIGGQDAKPGAWPWQIALKRSGRFICGGSLISPTWVVTAAHCVAGSSNPASYQIVVGDHNRNTNEGTEQTFNVKKIISHPSYNNPRLSSDIALIELASPVTISQRVNPICLPSHDSDVPTGSTCYITGWGKIRHPGSSHHILQQAMMPPIDNAKCKQKIQASGVSIGLTPQMLCAGVENTILSGCHGDSGGPYVCLNADKKTYTLHGAVSWGSGRCDAKQLFTVFARVTQFRGWIKQHTGLGGGGGGGGSPPPPPTPPTPPVPTTAGNSVFDCNFDKDMCGFFQSKNDTFDWTRKAGSTSSSSTGPSAGASGSGYYMYIETSSPRVNGDDAKLVKGGLSFITGKKLDFEAHMYGGTIGTLNVYVGQTKVFSRSGNQGNKWQHVTIDIPADSGASELTFKGIRGTSYTGDIAIDNVMLKENGGGGGGCGSTATPTPPPPPPTTTAAPPPPPTTTAAPPPPPSFKCNFDSDVCGFSQETNDKFDWTRKSGSTSSSGTGPSGDHTSGSGSYMYIETSYPRNQGDKAILKKTMQSGGCLTFYYHMYGASMGTLNVLVNGVNKFRETGNKGNAWHKAEVSVSSSDEVKFEGITGSSYTGDIAIDDIELKPGPCFLNSTAPPTPPPPPPTTTAAPPPLPTTTAAPPPPPSSSCNFDSDVCGFIQETNDQFDWTRKSGSTSSSSTGPSGDHTSGSGYYMYIETSSPRNQGDKAILITTMQSGGCLTFYYHMYGGSMGTLNVLVNGVNKFSAKGNKGNAWHKAEVSVSSSDEVKFEGIRGSSYTGDIAIDDIELKPGPCPLITPPPPTTAGTPPPPGSCGVRPQTRIVGGVAAQHGGWPWQAQLRTSSGFPYCGGTLVAPQWVVTATHCVNGKSPSSVFIRLGAHKRTSSVGTEQDFKVTKVITHPSYHNPKRYSHDIALLKLEKPAQLNRYVSLACLPHAVAAPGDGVKCWITGWGRLASGGATPNLLQQVSVPVTSHARCENSYPGKIHDSMICAGLDQGGIDSCQGDSGGPLVCATGGRYYLHGVTSWGYGCASAGKFGVYAKVKYVLNWVNSEMSNN